MWAGEPTWRVLANRKHFLKNPEVHFLISEQEHLLRCLEQTQWLQDTGSGTEIRKDREKASQSKGQLSH